MDILFSVHKGITKDITYGVSIILKLKKKIFSHSLKFFYNIPNSRNKSKLTS